MPCRSMDYIVIIECIGIRDVCNDRGSLTSWYGLVESSL